MAYAKLEPFGQVREEYRVGVLATVLGSAFGKKGAHYSPETFFPELGYARAVVKQSATTMKDRLIQITKALGGKIVKRGETPPEPAKSGKKRKKNGKHR